MPHTDLTWNTALLYPAPDSPELEAELDSFETLAADFRERYFEKIATLDNGAILAAMQEYEALQVRMAKPFCYAHLLFADDSGNETYLALSQRCSELGNRLSQQLLFFDLELMDLDDDRFETLCALPEAADYVHFLHGIRKFRPYTLKENEERLLTRKESDRHPRLYQAVRRAVGLLHLPHGTGWRRTGIYRRGAAVAAASSPRPMSASGPSPPFWRSTGEHGIVFNAVFNNMALDHGQEMELRGYESPIQPTNIGNEIPDEAVEHLMCGNRSQLRAGPGIFPLSKPRMLGMDRLRNCDVYAPVAEAEQKYAFDEAREMVVASYADYDPDFGRIVEAFFDERRVDVMPAHRQVRRRLCHGHLP